MAQKSTESESALKDEAIAAKDAAEMTPEHRDEMASKLIERFAIWSGVAGLIPVPVVDVVTVGGRHPRKLRDAIRELAAIEGIDGGIDRSLIGDGGERPKAKERRDRRRPDGNKCAHSLPP